MATSNQRANNNCKQRLKRQEKGKRRERRKKIERKYDTPQCQIRFREFLRPAAYKFMNNIIMRVRNEAMWTIVDRSGVFVDTYILYIYCVLACQRIYLTLCIRWHIESSPYDSCYVRKFCAQTQINTFKETGQNNKTMAVEFVTVVDLVKFVWLCADGRGCV